MIWLNPLAWIGLAAIALPVILHLIGRRRPKRLPFPTLRFLQVSALPRSRRRLEHLLLLLVRAAVLAAAVAALAQPVFLTASRTLVDGRPARAIVVDTSASMERAAADGSPAVVRARARAATLTAEARTAEVVEAGSLPAGLASAAAWLDHQRGSREIVVLSDLHEGTLDRADVARLDAAIGVRFERVATRPAATPVAAGARTTVDGTVEVAVEARARSTVVTWRRGAETGRPGLPIGIALPEALQAEQPAIEAAARAQGVPAGAASRRVEVRGSDLFSTDSRLVGSLLHRRESVENRSDPLTPADAVALIVAAAEAAVDTIDLREFEPNLIPDAVLRQWERPPAPATPGAAADVPGNSDGRWFWAASLLLIAIEWPLRRRARLLAAGVAPPPTEETPDARVA